jgi:hypothetical protein
LVKFFNKTEDIQKKDIKERLNSIKDIISESRKNPIEAFNRAKNGEVDKFHIKGGGTFYTIPIDKAGNILPIQEKNSFKVQDSIKAYEKLGQDFEKLGNYKMLPVSSIAKIFEIKDKSSEDKFNKVLDALPVDLQRVIKVEKSSIVMPKRMKIAFNDAQKVIAKYDILKKAILNYKKDTSYTTFFNAQKTFENFYKTNREKIQPDGKYFYLVNKNSMKIDNIKPELLAKKTDLEQFFTFSPSSKKIKDFIIDNELNQEQYEDLGIIKETSLAFFQPLKTEEDFKVFISQIENLKYGQEVDLKSIQEFNKLQVSRIKR